MRALMYHYIRPAPEQLPFFRYLHIGDFEAQLDALAAQHRLLGARHFGDMLDGAPVPADGMIFTFDDGLAEHYRWALPALEVRGLTGLFFVCSASIDSARPLDVHRIHHLLGRFGGDAVLEALQGALDPGMVDADKRALFSTATYTRQSNDAATTAVKRTLNYFVAESWRGKLLDKLAAALGVDPAWSKDFYLSSAQIADMQKRGHLVGSHGIDHRVMSALDEASQKRQIEASFAALDAASGGLRRRVFCYPYGGPDTFDRRSQALLSAAGCEAAFAVDPRPIEDADLAARRLALPRFDCNAFPFGRASLGATRARNQIL